MAKAQTSKGKAIGYVRVSDIGDRDVTSDSFQTVRQQTEAIDRLARRFDLEVIETIEEVDVSGKGGNPRRTGWKRAIEMIEAGEAEGFLCFNIARFARDVPDGLKACDRIEDAGGSWEMGGRVPAGLTRRETST